MARRREKLTLERILYSRFTILLVMLFGMLLILPILDTQMHIAAMRWLFSLTMIATIYAGSSRWRDIAVPLVFGIPAGCGRWMPLFHHDPIFFAVVTAFTILFLAQATFTILLQAARARRVTYDTVSAALCCYMLAGFAWAFTFSLVNTIHPGAFSFPSTTPPYNGADLQIRSEFLKFVYYSFTTITTAGYGDMLPVSPLARSLSIVEAITGQFYIAVMIARLVSLQVSHSDRERSNDIA
jgi:voltage-gated potassium channel